MIFTFILIRNRCQIENIRFTIEMDSIIRNKSSEKEKLKSEKLDIVIILKKKR